MTISEQKEIGRGKNVVLSFFERRLHVPKIYMDVVWDGNAVDVLAIDRSGVGDVHAALLFARPILADGGHDVDAEATLVKTLTAKLKEIPANFKYIAAIEAQAGPRWLPIFHGSLAEDMFAPDFVGRVGLLHIVVPEDGEPLTELRLRPERFRAKISNLADDFVMQHTPDWEIRDSPLV
jgi:hypothetical protein